jgi:hypothetical protein
MVVDCRVADPARYGGHDLTAQGWREVERGGEMEQGGAGWSSGLVWNGVEQHEEKGVCMRRERMHPSYPVYLCVGIRKSSERGA